MAVLYPQGDFARVYRVLEDLANGDARQIKTTTDGPGLGLVISDELYDRFLEAEGVTSEQAPKKRPGRPKKTES